jgi:hypothetical protein
MNAESSGHAKVHDERLSGIEISEQIFRAAGKPFHAPTVQALGKVRRKGDTQVAAAGFHARYPAMLQHARKPHAHGFDFGQFGHQGLGIRINISDRITFSDG